MLRGRTGQIVDGGKKSEIFKLPEVGCPQGEPTSPTLFNLCIDSLRSVFRKMGKVVMPSLFADDISFSCCGKSEQEALDTATKAVAMIEDHLSKLGLETAPSKSAGLLIGKYDKKFTTCKDNLKATKGDIPIVEKTKLLGYLMTNNLKAVSYTHLTLPTKA